MIHNKIVKFKKNLKILIKLSGVHITKGIKIENQ